MKVDSIAIEAALDNAKRLTKKEKDLSPALKSALEVLLLLVSILISRVTLNSRNSSKLPSPDSNRKKKF